MCTTTIAPITDDQLTYVVCLGTCQFILGEMGIHLITIKVSVVTFAVSIVQSEGLLARQHTSLQHRKRLEDE